MLGPILSMCEWLGALMQPTITSIANSLRKSPDNVHNEDCVFYDIYQIPPTEDYPNHAFMGLEYMREKGVEPNERLYRKVYAGISIGYDMIHGPGMTQENPELDYIFYMLNINPPKDYTARSLSVSDVIVISYKGEEQVWFIDSVGYVKLENFWNG